MIHCLCYDFALAVMNSFSSQHSLTPVYLHFYLPCSWWCTRVQKALCYFKLFLYILLSIKLQLLSNYIFMFFFILKDPSKDTTIQIDGNDITVPQGKPIPTEVSNSSSFYQSEYLVYTENQSRIRYLLTFKMHWVRFLYFRILFRLSFLLIFFIFKYLYTNWKIKTLWVYWSPVEQTRGDFNFLNCLFRFLGGLFYFFYFCFSFLFLLFFYLYFYFWRNRQLRWICKKIKTQSSL